MNLDVSDEVVDLLGEILAHIVNKLPKTGQDNQLTPIQSKALEKNMCDSNILYRVNHAHIFGKVTESTVELDHNLEKYIT